MEKSIFKILVDQYQTPHPFLGVDGQAFPMIPYSMKREMLQNAGASLGMSMDDLVRDETKRVKQVLDAANAYGDTQLATAVLDELYPLMVEDIESGSPIAVSVYSPVVNQMKYILGATRQPQPRVAVQKMMEEPAQELRQFEEEQFAPQEEEVIVQEETVDQEGQVAASVYEPVEPEGQPAVPANETIDDNNQPVALVAEPVDQEGQPVTPVSESAVQEIAPAIQESEPIQAEPKDAPVKARKKKRTPASAIVLFILGAAFLLAFLAIIALPLIGIGTSEAFVLTGLYDIGIACAALAVVCCVIAAIILWRSKKAKAR